MWTPAMTACLRMTLLVLAVLVNSRAIGALTQGTTPQDSSTSSGKAEFSAGVIKPCRKGVSLSSNLRESSSALLWSRSCPLRVWLAAPAHCSLPPATPAVASGGGETEQSSAALPGTPTNLSRGGRWIETRSAALPATPATRPRGGGRNNWACAQDFSTTTTVTSVDPLRVKSGPPTSPSP